MGLVVAPSALAFIMLPGVGGVYALLLNFAAAFGTPPIIRVDALVIGFRPGAERGNPVCPDKK